MDSEAFARISLKIEGSNSIQRESLLAEPDGSVHRYFLRSIPAFIYGIALNDLIEVLDFDSGKFTVIQRGGQVTIRLYVEGTLDRDDVRAVIEAVTTANGVFEVAKNASTAGNTSMLLLSLDVALGFKRIESLLERVPEEGCSWEYGNIYDQGGNPLKWWEG
jgi:hypothetical protein